jgi:hypothetical protein
VRTGPERERPCSRSGSGVISLDGPLTPAGGGAGRRSER